MAVLLLLVLLREQVHVPLLQRGEREQAALLAPLHHQSVSACHPAEALGPQDAAVAGEHVLATLLHLLREETVRVCTRNKNK